MVGAVSVWPELTLRTNPRAKRRRTETIRLYARYSLWKGVPLLFGEFSLSLRLLWKWQCSYKRLSKSWLNNFLRCQTQLFWVRLSSHAHPLDLSSSYNSSCSFDSPPLLSPLGSFQKCLNSFALMDFQLWCKTFQDWHVSLHRPSLSLFTSFYPPKPLHVMCSNQQFSHIHPSLSVSRPSVYSRFFVLFHPQLSRGEAPNGKFRSGRQAAIKHSFQLWMKGACMWNGTYMIDLQVIVTLTPELLLVIGYFQELLHKFFLSTKAIKLI